MKTKRYLTAKEIRELFSSQINSSIAHGEAEMKRLFPGETMEVKLIDEGFALQLYINGIASTRFTCKEFTNGQLELKFGIFEEAN